jgi:hypothetical protein
MTRFTGQRLRQAGRATPRLGATIGDGSGQIDGTRGNDAKFHPSTQWG